MKNNSAARVSPNVAYLMSLLFQILLFATAKGQFRLGYDGWFYIVAVVAVELTLVGLVFKDIKLSERFYRYLYLASLLTAWLLILFLIKAEGVSYFWMILPMAVKVWYIQSFVYKNSN